MIDASDDSPWECGECSRPENGRLRVDWVCHHCGKLLCADHRIELPDGAFSGSTVSPRRAAVHCPDCRDAFHGLGLFRRTGPT